MKSRKITALILTALFAAALLAGCGTTSGSSPSPSAAASPSASVAPSAAPSASTTAPSASAAAQSASPAAVTTVQVAVANDFNPYAYLDEKGQYIGYEVDVLKAVDDLLPQYQFNYQTVSDQFVALTADKVDLIAHQWESNPTRRETYLFADQLVTSWTAYIVSKDGRTDLQSYKDLEGKTVLTWQGSNDAYQLETYNKAHNNAIKLEYNSNSDFSVVINKIESGAVDAIILPKSFVQQFNEAYKVNLSVSNEPAYNSNTYFIYRNGDDAELALRDAVDGALKTLHGDGTLKKLSEQWLGGNYTEEAALPET